MSFITNMNTEAVKTRCFVPRTQGWGGEVPALRMPGDGVFPGVTYIHICVYISRKCTLPDFTNKCPPDEGGNYCGFCFSGVRVVFLDSTSRDWEKPTSGYNHHNIRLLASVLVSLVRWYRHTYIYICVFCSCPWPAITLNTSTMYIPGMQ